MDTERIRDILTILDSAAKLESMNLSSFHLHPMKGDKKRFWSITVRSNWRIIFKFQNGNAYDVDLTDYH